ncbi:hypothetical protein AB1Y20_010650 [Prymnesium parvum]|uniref:Hexosyltransferase n=1 Tax=Prymnesium parvum TaxID=97485 RepID=A0AB34IP67_PRYPA
MTHAPTSPHPHAARGMRWLNLSAGWHAGRHNSSRCGDGCLDRLVVSIKRSHAHKLALLDGELRLRADDAALLRRRPPRRAAPPPPPILLLGLLSGSFPRRELLRCTWMRVPALRRAVRTLFIVGRASAEPRADVLAVDVVEGERMRNYKQNHTTTYAVHKAVRTGTLTTYWKLTKFLQYAATQPEPMVGRADDDVLISPRMLVAYASVLLQYTRASSAPYLYGGVFEWYSWRTGTLMSTGFGLSAGASRTRRKKAWRNCSATGLRTSAADPCVGPLAFAKGPLMLLSTAAIRAVVEGPHFRRDVARARSLANGSAVQYKGPGSGRIDDDVQLGFWLSQLPGLSVVSFRRYVAWHDRWKQGVSNMIHHLLLAHKVPWAEFRTLLNHSEMLWHASTSVSARLACEGPPCLDCAHRTSQRACAIDLELDAPPRTVDTRSCWPKCVFVKATPPEVPGQCWTPPTF